MIISSVNFQLKKFLCLFLLCSIYWGGDEKMEWGQQARAALGQTKKIMNLDWEVRALDPTDQTKGQKQIQVEIQRNPGGNTKKSRWETKNSMWKYKENNEPWSRSESSELSKPKARDKSG